MRSTRTWWMIFAGCAMVVLGSLVWVTAEMGRLERVGTLARAEADHQEAMRLALWRLDSWFAPQLAREAARPYFDYQPFYPQPRAYTRRLLEIEPGDVVTPSPLLAYESEYVLLHFQVHPDGRITSPQVPTENLRELAERASVSADRVAASSALLARVTALIATDEVAQCVSVTEADLVRLLGAAGGADPPVVWNPGADPQARSRQELVKRQQTYAQNAAMPTGKSTGPGSSAVEVGPLVPVWAGSVPGSAAGAALDAPALLFVRRVHIEGEAYLQGFMCDWPALDAALCVVIIDLFPAASLVPVAPAGMAAASASMLATIPLRLEVAAAPAAALARTLPPVLVLTWLAVVVALVAVAVTLHASIAFGESRSRFASAVTHELRTPLTTFRMYSEMLAEGMIKDDDTRRAYLNTLRDESDRLAMLVENVLAYTRLERGARRVEPKETTLAVAIDDVSPVLQRLADRAGMDLTIDLDGSADAPLHVDVDALGQILSNLVDNAGKYAAEARDRAIDLTVGLRGGTLTVEVRDHGPGVRPEHARAIFAPFDRGPRAAGDPTAGVGLGLALARGLARSLGGDLRLLPAGAHDRSPNGAGPGACFALTLPAGGRDPASPTR